MGSKQMPKPGNLILQPIFPMRISVELTAANITQTLKFFDCFLVTQNANSFASADVAWNLR